MYLTRRVNDHIRLVGLWKTIYLQSFYIRSEKWSFNILSINIYYYKRDYQSHMYTIQLFLPHPILIITFCDENCLNLDCFQIQYHQEIQSQTSISSTIMPFISACLQNLIHKSLRQSRLRYDPPQSWSLFWLLMQYSVDSIVVYLLRIICLDSY